MCHLNQYFCNNNNNNHNHNDIKAKDTYTSPSTKKQQPFAKYYFSGAKNPTLKIPRLSKVRTHAGWTTRGSNHVTPSHSDTTLDGGSVDCPSPAHTDATHLPKSSFTNENPRNSSCVMLSTIAESIGVSVGCSAVNWRSKLDASVRDFYNQSISQSITRQNFYSTP